jgi:hypothetical protein
MRRIIRVSSLSDFGFGFVRVAGVGIQTPPLQNSYAARSQHHFRNVYPICSRGGVMRGQTAGQTPIDKLLMVGAHNGSKQKNAILGAASRGAVILLEPVPYLYDQLVQTFGSINNINLERTCVAEKAGKAAFFAPSPGSNAVAPWGDQLGSMHRDHASLHHPAFAAHVSELARLRLRPTSGIKYLAHSRWHGSGYRRIQHDG